MIPRRSSRRQDKSRQRSPPGQRYSVDRSARAAPQATPRNEFPARKDWQRSHSIAKGAVPVCLSPRRSVNLTMRRPRRQRRGKRAKRGPSFSAADSEVLGPGRTRPSAAQPPVAGGLPTGGHGSAGGGAGGRFARPARLAVLEAVLVAADEPLTARRLAQTAALADAAEAPGCCASYRSCTSAKSRLSSSRSWPAAFNC